MTKSLASSSKPLMGRADILFRFLKRIGKDRPQDIDLYMDELNGDIEDRPIVPQVIDRIIAGDQKLYDEYSHVRHEVLLRYPDSSHGSSELSRSYQQALELFLREWVTLERVLKSSLEKGQEADRLGAFPTPYLLEHLEWISDETRQEIEQIRYLRNEVVHGTNYVSEIQLVEATKRMQQVLPALIKEMPADLKKESNPTIEEIQSIRNEAETRL